MTGLESAALGVGRSVVRQVALTWLAGRKAQVRRGAELTELIALRFGGVRQRGRNDLRRRFDELGELAGERLEELCEREFAGLDDAERVAALEAVAVALDEAELSDTTLFGAGLVPVELAKEVRRRVPSATRRAGLGETGRALFDRALDLCCVQVVHLVRELPEYGPRVAEEALRRATEVLSGVERLLARLPVTSLDAPAGADHDEEFRRRYLQAVADDLDDLELIGVRVHNFRPRTRLSVAYLSLSVNQEGPARAERRNPLTRHWFESDRRERGSNALRVESALSTSNLTLVRGEAGSGKSTLLRWLAVSASRANFGHDLEEWNGCVPILVKLRSYAGQALPQPEQFLPGPGGPMLGPITEGWTHRQLLAGRALLLVDGVDELTDGERPKVRRWLGRLLRSYPRTRIVVTSRPAAAGTKWLQSEGFAAVDLEPLNPGDVREFIDLWHAALLAGENALPFSRDQVEEHRRGLLSKLDARSHLRGLARSPLMCAMLCALHLDRGGDLPRDRKSLYEAALEMLLHQREDVRRIPVHNEISLPYRQKLLLLQDLAFWLNLNSRSELSREVAVSRVGRKLRAMSLDVTAEDCLEHLVQRSGVVREPVAGRIDFVHRTFQEFLAAREAADEGHVDLLVDKATSDLWRETVIMASALLNRPGRTELLTGILDRADGGRGRNPRRLRLLAASCRESLHELPPALGDRLDAAIHALVPPRNKRESQSLATVGESLLDHLPTDITNLTTAQAAACVRTAALVNGPGALELLTAYAADPRRDVQAEIRFGWDLFDPETYARKVLAHAPLHSGHLLVDRLEQVPHVGHMTALETLSVRIFETVSSLEFLSEAATLKSLVMNGNGVVSLRPLSKHTGLEVVGLGSAQEWADPDSLSGLVNLEELLMIQMETMDDTDFLVGLTGLRRLLISEARDLSGVGELSRTGALTVLDLHWYHDLGDELSAMSGITTLTLSSCGIDDLEPVTRMPALVRLSLRDCRQLSDFAPLARMRRLRELELAGLPAGTDLSPLAGTDIQVTLDEVRWESPGRD
ncbi:NACHT domain-containing protein [Saccharopolyspora erythraea NRRL 2338]|uniref:Large ATP-binding protein n=2 Tax=Saccharopolyspora erythraea TaxID=1836 RepID=A4F915_SACEN|nr:NACHT domain-containing protein [Saccharopolyspora erythraea]EQD87236.1 ATP-binding protein [Saccharopolyspora erythraea D]PFG94333.1 NACHT domain-containing protein [Saccharopolyspora erythraea NRRL 2338]CAM00540.1 large ATP-binding protein [Saccharopolyspora erythraea NRRL 2338]